MPTINVIPSWNVKKLTEDQAMSGTIPANGVYKFLYTRDNAQMTQIMSIKEIIPVTAEGSDEPIDYKVVPSVIFFENGFDAFDDLKEEDTLLVSEIDEVEREFVKYEALDRAQRRKSVDEDPFIFNFINPKTSKPFQIRIDHNHFVGIPAMTKKGEIHTIFGYIDSVETDPETGMVTKLIMQSIVSNRGVFRAGKSVIPYDKLRGIYHYMITITPYKTKKKETTEAPAAEVVEAADEDRKDSEE